jgi:hypothetical protein
MNYYDNIIQLSAPNGVIKDKQIKPRKAEPLFVRGAQRWNAHSILPWSSACGSLFEGPKMQCIFVEPGGSLPSAKAETNKKGPALRSLYLFVVPRGGIEPPTRGFSI